MIIQLTFAALLGLAIGSFLNVCIYRIPIKESVVMPASHCMNCNKRLKMLDLVPVFSYVFLKGKCRYCGQKISPRYAFVELLTSVIFSIIYYKYSFTFDFFTYCFLMSILIAVFFIDIDHMIIPNKLVLVGLIGGIVVIIYNIFKPMSIYGDKIWWNPIVGMFVGSGFLFVVALIGMVLYKSEEVLGMGDIKIFLPIGIFLGWKMTIVALYISIVIAGVIGLGLLMLKIRKRKSRIAFGPFIVVATFITIIWGWDLLRLWM